jgi:hypothetical protein
MGLRRRRASREKETEHNSSGDYRGSAGDAVRPLLLAEAARGFHARDARQRLYQSVLSFDLPRHREIAPWRQSFNGAPAL